MTNNFKFKKNLAAYKPSGRGMVYVVPEFAVSECFCNEKRTERIIKHRDKEIAILINQLNKAEKQIKRLEL